ncbi:MAG TPA: Hsp20/alpha crystallin family protein [Kofleriaceae bacterium]
MSGQRDNAMLDAEPISFGATRASHLSSASTSRWICSSVFVSFDMNPSDRRSELRFTVEDRALVIAGELDVVPMERAGDVWRGQRPSGRFYPSGRYPSVRLQRFIPLREGVDPASSGARFENGVLEIRLRARRQWSRARQIEIDTGSAQPDRPGRSPRVKP